MSRLGISSLFVSILALAILLAMRFYIGGWINFLFIPLVVFLLGLVGFFVLEYRSFLEFMTMRTTKHGMNMGSMILLVLALMVCINFLATRYNKSFDVTQEGINSLAPQSLSLVKNLKQDLWVKVFYLEGEQSMQMRQQVRQNLALYQESSPRVKYQQYNAHVDNLEANRYLADQPDKNNEQIFVFAEYGQRRLRIDPPFAEEQLTSAFVKVTREADKKIYFLTGHGERDLGSEQAEGLRALVQSLEESAFKVEPLNLVEKSSIPADADLLVIAGSASQLLEPEVKLILDYARGGGRLLIAADPGQRHNLALLTKPMGVEFQNNYLIETCCRTNAGGVATAIGFSYDPSHEVTKSLVGTQMWSIFDLASELRQATDHGGQLQMTEIVKSSTKSFTINELSMPALQAAAKTAKGIPMALAIAVKGKMGGEPAATKDFAAVIFGDSDFLSNKSLYMGYNRDLALNAVAYLVNAGDLISIRPKQLAGTKVKMFTQSVQFFVVTAGLSLPMIFLILSGVVWFRRRGA